MTVWSRLTENRQTVSPLPEQRNNNHPGNGSTGDEVNETEPHSQLMGNPGMWRIAMSS
jgi:hypothetical protein